MEEYHWRRYRNYIFLIPLFGLAAAAAAKPASEIIPALMSEADRFAAGASQHDDMTLVVLKMCEARAA